MSVSLRSLPDHELLARTHALVTRERKITLEVLQHLNEIERRKLHLKRGYSTMFEYCTVAVGYSASAAMRRIQAARCLDAFPEVHALLDANEVNLSTICIVAKHLTPENKTGLLQRICKKSQREVEAIVAGLEPLATVPRDRVRTVVVRVPAEPNYRNGNRTLPMAAPAQSGPGAHYRNGNKPADPKPMQLEERSVVQFSASKTFMAKLSEIRALAAHRLPANATLEQVLELALDCFIEKEDPKRRQERREVRNRPSGKSNARVESPHSIPASVRDKVFVRDQQQCTYVGTNGKHCTSTHALQIDHIQPVARGGHSSMGNLRLLCARHNRLEAERLMGRSGPRDGPLR